MLFLGERGKGRKRIKRLKVKGMNEKGKKNGKEKGRLREKGKEISGVLFFLFL